MMALVSAGFARGLTGETHITVSRKAGVVARQLASRVPQLTTYLLRLEGEPSDELAHFIEGLQAIKFPDSPQSLRGHHPDPTEEPLP